MRISHGLIPLGLVLLARAPRHLPRTLVRAEEHDAQQMQDREDDEKAGAEEVQRALID